jgi:hypothetical protein
MGHTTDATRRVDLEGAVMQMDLTELGFIAPLILPPLRMPAGAGFLETMPRSQFFQQTAAKSKRAENADAPRIQTGVGETPYVLNEYKVASDWDTTKARTLHPNRNPQLIQERKAQICAMHALRDWEADVVGLLTNTTITPASGATGITLGTPWDQASAKPITDIQVAREANRRRGGGRRPNTLVLGAAVVPYLAANAEVRARIGGGTVGVQPDMLTAEMLAQAIGIQRVIIHEGIQSLTDDGQPTTLTDMFNADFACLLTIDYSAPENNLGILPTWGRTLLLEDEPEPDYAESEPGIVMAQTAIQVYSYGDGAHKKVIEAGFFAGLFNQNPECLYLMANVLS